MKNKLSFLTACFFCMSSLLISCKKNETSIPSKPSESFRNISNSKDSIFKGEKIKLFSGKAWVWIKRNTDETPKQLAIALTDAVLNSVPDSSEEEYENVVPAPPGINQTAFQNFGIDWSPQGHLPQGIYDKPLFDLHFYTISETERQSIFTDSNYYQDFRTYPSQKYLPKSYGLIDAGGIPGGGCITGTHWYDTTASEFHGQTFTQAFVYGTYNGKVDFYDPMISLDFLKSTNEFIRPIPQPSKFLVNGYYPTQLHITKHNGVTDIILEKFVMRHAS